MSPEQIISILKPHLTPERFARLEQVAGSRSLSLVPVLEDIYDRGNTSAVMRSAEAFGCQDFHVIELQEKFKVANRVTQGADKWLSVRKWSSTVECLQNLKRSGYRILCTALEGAKPVDDYKFDVPTAVVFGNEKRGVSSVAKELSDGTIFLPMQGFVQSFNISVAAALTFSHIVTWRKNNMGQHGDLTECQKIELLAQYCMKSLESSQTILAQHGWGVQRTNRGVYESTLR